VRPDRTSIYMDIYQIITIFLSCRIEHRQPLMACPFFEGLG
jgi:hypothetical protein